MTTTAVSGQRLRRCYHCRRWLALTDFYRSRSAPEGRAHLCARCDRAASAAYRAANLNAVRARDVLRKRRQRASSPA